MGGVGGLLTAFIVRNRRLARRIERLLRHPAGYEHNPLQYHYVKTVAEYANASPGQVIVDIGAGRHCHFSDRIEPGKRGRIIGIDVSAEAMASNDALDEKLVADVVNGLPLSDASVDLVVSMSTLEHLRRVGPVAEEIFRVLKPGGHTIHIVPSRNAPYALLNRFLPRRLSRALLRVLIPGSVGIQGFPAWYDHCTPEEMERLLERSGFRVARMEWSFYQSDYYAFFLPLYLASLAYDLLIQRLNARQLAAAVLVVAQKPNHGPGQVHASATTVSQRTA